MIGRYRVRWSLLAVTFGLFVVVPLVASFVFGVDLWPISIAWLALIVVGASGAGLRARGSVTQTLHYEPDQEPRRDADEAFRRPPNEGSLL
jgi:hypothetical protein